jgi:hypothetical protein
MPVDLALRYPLVHLVAVLEDEPLTAGGADFGKEVWALA